MTLILTLIRPEGIWQSADNRVSLGDKVVDDSAPKQLYIVFPPDKTGPKALLAFTGLAEFSDGTPTLRWIRETLRGETRTIMESLDHLVCRLNRDVGQSDRWGNRLIITGGVFEGEKRFYVEIRNVDPKTGKVRKEFDYQVSEVTRPYIFMAGSVRYVSKTDVELMLQQADIRPAKWEDHLGLLAAVNRRTASKDRYISPWCQGTYVSSGIEGAQGKRFSKPGEPDGPPGTETLLFGIDLSDIMRELHQSMLSLKSAKADPNPDRSTAYEDSVKGRP